VLTGSKTYGYDALDRLTSFSDGTTSISYAYDATGNRTSQTIGGNANTYAIATNSNRVNSIAGAATTLTYVHDANGSVTNDGSKAFVYDATGRLTSVTGVATYQLNGLGQRVKKTANSATTLFAYDEAGKLIGEYDQAGSVIQETVYLGDLPLATIKLTGTYYIHADHLNTPRQINNQQGQAVWTWDTATFGASLPNDNPSGLGAFKYNLRHAGQYADEETGLFYNYFRDYDPKTGRYVQSDPIGLAGGINTYAYVGGNPLSNSDPLGLASGVRVCFFGICGPPIFPGSSTTSSSTGNSIIDDLLNGGSASQSSSSSSSSSSDSDSKACPPKPGNQDPCKGFRKNVAEHERKLQQYISNPSSMDNRGDLAAAYATGDMNQVQLIISARITSLTNQIAFWKKELEKCEKANGK